MRSVVRSEDAEGVCRRSPRRSSSASEISCEVLGVSWGFWLASKMDCLEMEEASVKLPASPAGPGGCSVCVPEPSTAGAAVAPPDCPVMSSLRKESTSSDAFPAVAPGLLTASEAASPDPCSISCSVLPNGFNGGRCLVAEDGNDVPEISVSTPGLVLRNGSSPASLSDSLLLVLELSFSSCRDG